MLTVYVCRYVKLASFNNSVQGMTAIVSKIFTLMYTCMVGKPSMPIFSYVLELNYVLTQWESKNSLGILLSNVDDCIMLQFFSSCKWWLILFFLLKTFFFSFGGLISSDQGEFYWILGDKKIVSGNASCMPNKQWKSITLDVKI